SAKSCALWAPSEKLTQMSGLAPISSQNWQNSSIPTSLESIRPQILLGQGVRWSRSPMPFFQRYWPGSTVEPPQRRMAGRISWTASTTSARQPFLLSLGMRESLLTQRQPWPSARNSKTAQSVWPMDFILREYFCHLDDGAGSSAEARVNHWPVGSKTFSRMETLI